MTPSVLVADVPAPRTQPVPLRSAPFLYGLSLAVVLPSAAWLPPAHPALPTIHRSSGPLLDRAELQMMFGRPIAEVGQGRIGLGDVDWRLNGLSLALDVLRAGPVRGALVAIGVVGPDRATIGAGRATPADLWALAREMIPRHGLARGWRVGPRADAILVHYGGATSQVAWLAADHLVTVSVSDLDGHKERRTELAHTLACLLASR